jgi:hypothetical protein
MISENILYKDDSAVRGAPVVYSLTRKAHTQRTLKILGIDAKVERRKHLYRLLLFYESYKRRPLLTEKQLHTFLKKIGCAPNNLEEIEKRLSPFDKTVITTFRQVKGIEILRLEKSGLYYIVIPGFSADEFIQYLRNLKKGKDPRPFSSTSPRVFVPLVHSTDYSKDEVGYAIDSFRQEGFIRQIMPVFPDETRFQIVDDSLLGFIHSIWFIHMIDYHLLIGRLAQGKKPTDEDKKYLSLFLGKKGADRMLTLTYHIRRKENDRREIKQNKASLQALNEYRQSVTQSITQTYEKVIKENEVAAQILQEVCFSPII